jgi:hypothetical protein
MQAVLLAAVNSGNRKTWQLLLPTFRFGSNNREQNFSSMRQIRQNPVDCAGKKRYD